MFAVIREGWIVAEDAEERGLKEASYIFVSRAVCRILFRANLIDSLRSGFSCGRFEWKNKVAKWTSQGVSRYCQLLGLRFSVRKRRIMKELALHQFSIVRMFQILFRECLSLGSDLKFHAVLITSDRSIPRVAKEYRRTARPQRGRSNVLSSATYGDPSYKDINPVH